MLLWMEQKFHIPHVAGVWIPKMHFYALFDKDKTSQQNVLTKTISNSSTYIPQQLFLTKIFIQLVPTTIGSSTCDPIEHSHEIAVSVSPLATCYVN